MKPRPSLASIFGNAETGGVAGWCDADRLLSEPPPPPPKPAPKASSFPPLQMTAVRRFVGVGDHRRRFVALAGAGALLLLLVGWASAGDAAVTMSDALAAAGEQAAAALPAVAPVEPVVKAPVKEAPPVVVPEAKQDEPKQDAAPDVARASEDAKPKRGAFDRDAARNAVFGAAGSASACKVKGGPTGRGKASVTIGPSGSVVSVSVSGPFGGKVGSCLNRVFRSVRVPPFEGSPVTLSKTFTIR